MEQTSFHHLNRKQRKLVANEINSWFDAGIVDLELAEKLRALYPDVERGPNISGALSIIGAILIGLGVILFLASNWHMMAVGLKLLLILVAIAVANYTGWRLRFGKANRPRLGDALLLLGGLFYGAAIWLISQMFNIDTHFADGLLLWGGGTILSALALRSLPLGILSSVLFCMWSFNFNNSFDYGHLTTGQTLSFFTALALSIGLTWFLKSRSIAWITMIFGGSWFVIHCPLHLMAALLYGTTVFAIYLWVNKHQPLFRSSTLTASMICVLGALLTYTSSEMTVKVAENQWIFALLLCSALISSMLVAWRLPEFKYESLSCAFLTLIPWLFMGLPETPQRVAFNILFLAVIAGLVYSGLRRLKSPAVINYALVFFVFDILARYFDFFFTMMNRSIFFLVGGIVLMVVGAVTEGERRKLMSGFGKSGSTASAAGSN